MFSWSEPERVAEFWTISNCFFIKKEQNNVDRNEPRGFNQLSKLTNLMGV
jgi:hypothetical protein